MTTRLVFLLFFVYLAAASTVVVTHNIKPTGEITVVAKVREIYLNNNPTPLNISGVLVPPYSAVVHEETVTNIYPPFLKVEPSLTYLNGKFHNGVLHASNDTLVLLRLEIRSLLPTPTPVMISVSTDDKVAVIYEKRPSVSQMLGATVYYWTIVVENYTEFALTFRIKQFGSFGAVRLPTVSLTSILDINQTISIIRDRQKTVDTSIKQLKNFTNLVSLYSDIVYSQIQNLTQLIQIFNLAGAALIQGAGAINTSTYALEALRLQISALGDAVRGIATTINQSRLLVEYQYVALVTAANALETQSAALVSYNSAVGQTVEGLEGTRRGLESIRWGLYNQRQIILNGINALEMAKLEISKIQTNATDLQQAAIRALDTALTQLYMARDSIDATIGMVDDAISIVDSTTSTLEAVGRSLSELAPLLNSTAASTRKNATYILQSMPEILLNVSNNLLDVSRNLHKVSTDVVKYSDPLYNASRILLEVGNRLVQSAKELEDFRKSQLEILPKLGFLQSSLHNYSDFITREKERLELEKKSLEQYRSAINATAIELQYHIELPIAMRNITINPPPITSTLEPKRQAIDSTWTVVLLTIIAVGALLIRRIL